MHNVCVCVCVCPIQSYEASFFFFFINSERTMAAAWERQQHRGAAALDEITAENKHSLSDLWYRSSVRRTTSHHPLLHLSPLTPVIWGGSQNKTEPVRGFEPAEQRPKLHLYDTKTLIRQQYDIFNAVWLQVQPSSSRILWALSVRQHKGGTPRFLLPLHYNPQLCWVNDTYEAATKSPSEED